jgi:hypothetical protein
MELPVTETDPANERPPVQETASPRNAMPTTIPSTVACAKISIAIPINAATIQSALLEPSLIG